jgi:hypothetical protein
VRWHAESPFIECHKGHHVSLRRCGERRVLRHRTSLELHCRHKPMLHKFLQVAWRNGGRSPILLYHGSRRKGMQQLRDPDISSYFIFPRFLLFPPLFLFPGVGKERMTDGVQGYRGAQGRPLALNPMSSVVKRLGPLRCSKGPGKLSLPTFPIPCTSHQLQQQGIQKPYPQWAPRRQGGSAKAQGLKAKPARRVRAAQSNQSDGRSVTKGGHQLVHLVLH